MTGKHSAKKHGARKASVSKDSAGKVGAKDGSSSGQQDRDPVPDLAYEPSVNQTGHHPMPASADDDAGQAAVRENEEHWRRSHAKRRAPRTERPGDEDG